MSISLLYMPVKFQIEIAKDDKKIDFSLGGYLFSPPCIYTGDISVNWNWYKTEMIFISFTETETETEMICETVTETKLKWFGV